MTKRCRQWTVRRQFVPVLNGWSRWDRAYQQMLQWTWSEQEGLANTVPLRQESSHEDGHLCAGVDQPASPDSNH